MLKRFISSSVTFFSFDVEPNKIHEEARTSSQDDGCHSSVSKNWPAGLPSFKWGGNSNETRLAMTLKGKIRVVTERGQGRRTPQQDQAQVHTCRQPEGKGVGEIPQGGWCGG